MSFMSGWRVQVTSGSLQLTVWEGLKLDLIFSCFHDLQHVIWLAVLHLQRTDFPLWSGEFTKNKLRTCRGKDWVIPQWFTVAPGLPSTSQLYEPRAEEGPWPVGEEDASAQEAVWSLASCLLYSVYQLFVNFAASKLNCKKHRRWLS